MKLIVGTRSPGKTREIRELFAGLPFDLTFPADRLLEPLPEEADLERSMSYVENAVAKARYFATRAGLPAVSDDSGIEVDALGGAPPRGGRRLVRTPRTTRCCWSSWRACLRRGARRITVVSSPLSGRRAASPRSSRRPATGLS